MTQNKQSAEVLAEYENLKKVFAKEKDIVSMYGTCKRCKQKKFIGRDFLCSRCNFPV